MLRDPTRADAAPRVLTTRPAAVRAAAIVRAVTPLVGGVLALQGEFVRSAGGGASAVAADGPVFDRFAEQLLAAARLLAGCAQRAGGIARARRGDAVALPLSPSMDPAGVASSGSDAEPRLDRLRRLLATEHELARALRHAIATCDAHADDRTTDCLEAVLDEVRGQQAVLTGLLVSAGA